MSDFFRLIVHDLTVAVVGVVVAIGLLPAPSNPTLSPMVDNHPATEVTSTTTPKTAPVHTNTDRRTNPKQDVSARPQIGTTTSSHTLLSVPTSKTKPQPTTSSPATENKPLEKIPEKTIDLSTIASINSATIDEMLVYTIAKPTLSGRGNIRSLDKKGYVTLVITDSTKKEIFRQQYVEILERSYWYSIVTTPLKNGNYIAELYDAKDQTFLARQTFAVALTPVDSGQLSDTSGTGLLEEHIGQSLSRTASISYNSALSNCQLNAKSNPASEVTCYWNGKKIFGQLGKAATIDQITLTTPSPHPTFTGTASGLSAVGALIYSKTKCLGCASYYAADEDPLEIPVINGRWTYAVTEKTLLPGLYGLSLTYKDNGTLKGLNSGTIVITE